MMPVLALVEEVLTILPGLIQLGVNVVGLVQQTRAVLDANAAPDDATWASLDAQITALQAELAKDPD